MAYFVLAAFGHCCNSSVHVKKRTEWLLSYLLPCDPIMWLGGRLTNKGCFSFVTEVEDVYDRRPE